MNIKESQRLMKIAMKANVPYLLVGHSGIGKTQITEQIAKDVFPNHKFVTVMASQQDVGDFIGIPDIVKLETNDKKGKKSVERVTSWARPEWMPYEPCVIFLDELNNARPDVESAMLQLVLEKRIHTHTLHPDSYICAAINPASSEYTTANTMSTALVKRFMVISFEPLATEFIAWGETSKRLHPKLVSFLKHQPNISGAEKKLDTLIKMEPCPRLWVEAVSKMLTVIEADGNSEDRSLIQDMLVSSVGVNAAAAFLGWLDTQDKPLSFEEITKNATTALKKYNSFYDDMRNDLIGGTNENIIKGIKDMHEDLVGKIAYKVSILEYDRNSDQNLVKEAVKELNYNVKNNFGENKDKLDNLIKFLLKVPNDALFQISQNLITHKPFLDETPGQDKEEYNKEQLKRFDAYNTLMFYLYRDDVIDNHKGLYDRFVKATEEVEKHKAKTEKKEANG